MKKFIIPVVMVAALSSASVALSEPADNTSTLTYSALPEPTDVVASVLEEAFPEETVSPEPTATATEEPAPEPTVEPTEEPITEPTAEPTPDSSVEPDPTDEPTEEPYVDPRNDPRDSEPTEMPSRSEDEVCIDTVTTEFVNNTDEDQELTIYFDNKRLFFYIGEERVSELYVAPNSRVSVHIKNIPRDAEEGSVQSRFGLVASGTSPDENCVAHLGHELPYN